MVIIQYFFGALIAIGFVLIVWAPFNDFFREGWKTRIPIYGLRWRPNESWIMAFLGLLLLFGGMVGLALTWK
jgi:hypothetical protein